MLSRTLACRGYGRFNNPGLKRAITSETSWTLPDVRPKTEVLQRSRLGMLRVNAEAFADEVKRSELGMPNGSRRSGGPLGRRASRPGGEPARKAFRAARQLESRGSMGNRAKRMSFGVWN